MATNMMTWQEAIEKLEENRLDGIYGYITRPHSPFKIVRQLGYPDGIPCNEQTARIWGLEKGQLFKCFPYLQAVKDGHEMHFMFFPTSTDLGAEDWEFHSWKGDNGNVNI